MKIRSVAFAAMMFALTGLAQAHTHLQSAVPADNSVVAAPPTQITLNFSEPTRLTALTIQKDAEKEQKRIDALPKTAAQAHSVPVAALAAGKYVVSWRAVGPDNHPMSGTVSFTVAGK